MHQIVYASSAPQALNAEQLAAILKVARRNNERLNVTGMLLYRDGNFLQVLEGAKAAVTALFEKIGKDSRHQGVILILEETAETREFPDWTMGFHHLELEDLSGLTGFREMDLSLDPSHLAEEPTRARRLLSLFRQM